MTRDYEKPFILLFRGSLTNIRTVCRTIAGFPSNQMSPYCPAGSLWSKKAFTVSFHKVLRKKSS